jgi:hypothetical protein
LPVSEAQLSVISTLNEHNIVFLIFLLVFQIININPDYAVKFAHLPTALLVPFDRKNSLIFPPTSLYSD